MNVVICYPVPIETPEVWATFKPFVQRFADSFRTFPPGVKARLRLVLCGKDDDRAAEAYGIFDGIDFEALAYLGAGADLGAQQTCALCCTPFDTFQVNLTTRCYAHRAGWLLPLVGSRLRNGPGLYGMSWSREGGKFHICTRGHAYDVGDFLLYPHEIKSRDQGVFFELGEGSITRWFHALRGVTWVVQFDGEIGFSAWDTDTGLLRDGFREGNQSNMLLWDKHSDAFRLAGGAERDGLRRLQTGASLTA